MSLSSTIFPLLMISKIPTYSLKKIIIPRNTTVFLLFSIGLYFGLLIFFTFKILFVTGVIYLLFIPISAIHYKKLKKERKDIDNFDDEIHEDML